MSAASKLVTRFVETEISESESQEVCKSISDLILRNQLKIVDLILNLGTYLQDSNESTRARAIQCLHFVIDTFPENYVNGVQVSHLVTFFASKADEPLAFASVLGTLKKLIEMSNFYGSENDGDKNVKTVLQALTDNYNPKNYNATVRHGVLCCLKSISELPVSGGPNNDQFITTFINAASGEKDPRNLLISFELNAKIQKEFTGLENYKEQLFDISFCYFPIAFKPPKNDPYKITTQDLKSSLRATLTANEITINDLFPNLFEKFASNSISVKTDVLDTLQLAITKFSINSVTAHWLEIWDGLKFEILRATVDLDQIFDPILPISLDSSSEPAQISMLSSVCSLFTTLAKKNTFEIVPKMALDLESQKSSQAYLILSMISQADDYSFEYVISKFMPSLLNSKDSTLDEDAITIKELIYFQHAYNNLYGDKTLNSHEGSFSMYHDNIMILLTKSLSSSAAFLNLKIVALKSIDLLVKSKTYLLKGDLTIISNSVFDVLIEIVASSDSGSKKIYPYCLQVLVSIANTNPDVITDTIYPKLFSVLQDYQDSLSDEFSGIVKVERSLSILGDISSANSYLLDHAFVQIFAKLYVLKGNIDPTTKYAVMLLSMLYNTTEKFYSNSQSSSLSLNHFIEKSIETIMRLVFANAIFYQDVIIELFSKIVFIMLLNLDSSRHQALLEKYIDIFSAKSPSIFKNPSKFIQMFVKILAAIDYKAVKFVIKTPLLDFVATLCMLAKSSEYTYERLGYLQSICVTVNKWVPEFPETEVDSLLSKIHNSSTDFEVFIWLSKALVIKNSSLTKKCLMSLLEQFSSADARFGEQLCKGLEIIVEEGPLFKKYPRRKSEGKKILFKNKIGYLNNINASSLYKQRVFEIVIPKLIEMFNNANKTYDAKAIESNESIYSNDMLMKKNCLTSICFVSRHMNTEILFTKIEDFLPLIVESIKLKSSLVKVAALETLSSLITSKTSKLIGNYLSTLIPSLMDCTKSSNYFRMDLGSNQSYEPELVKMNTKRVRELSLDCLTKLTQVVDLIKLIPFKNEVLRSLEIPLDDTKRSVRQRACACRQEFFDLGQVQS